MLYTPHPNMEPKKGPTKISVFCRGTIYESHVFLEEFKWQFL